MVRIRLVHISGSQMTLLPRWWRRWQRTRPNPEETEPASQARQRSRTRREVGIPIGQHWELRFCW